MQTNDVVFGLIGYGLWGTYHARAIAKTAGAKLAAIAVPSDKSQAAARDAHPDVDVYGDYHKMLQREDLEVVDVVVPTHLHHQVSKAVLEANKHLLLEKPMALKIEHCDELIALAEQKGKVLAVGHEMRVSALWRKIKELIDSGVIGTPQYVLIELSRIPYRLGSGAWRYDVKRVGNWILEEPIHFFDVARWYLSGVGEPVSVYACANSKQPNHPELKDNFAAIVSFSGGGFAMIAQTLAAFEHHIACKVTGTEGAAWARWSGACDRSPEMTFSLTYFDGTNLEEVFFEKGAGEVVELDDEIASFVRSVRGEALPMCSGVDGKWSVLLCLAAQESVETGRPISIEEVAAGSS